MRVQVTTHSRAGPAVGVDLQAALDLGAVLAGALGHGLRDVGGVDVAVGRMEDRALQVVGAHQRPAVPDLRGGQPFVLDPHGLGGGGIEHVFVHAVLRLRHAQVADDVEAGVEAGLGLQRLVEPDRIVVDMAGRVAHVEERQQPRRVPGRARGQLVALDQHHLPAGFRQVIGDAGAHRAAADDKGSHMGLHGGVHGATLRARFGAPCRLRRRPVRWSRRVNAQKRHRGAGRTGRAIGCPLISARGWHNDQGAADAETLRWARVGDALTLDPHSQNEGPTHTLNHHIYETLVGRALDGSLTPRLATEWEIDEDDDTVWVFKIREGVTFHEGQELTAEDVVFSLDRARTPPSGMAALHAAVEEVTAEDDYTVRVRWPGPAPLYVQNLTNTFIMSKEWAEEHNVETAPELRRRRGGAFGAQHQRHRPLPAGRARPRGAHRAARCSRPLGRRAAGDRDHLHPDQRGRDAGRALLSGEVDLVQDVPVQDIARLEQTDGVASCAGRRTATSSSATT
jgi:hypothetical protein